MQRVFFTSVLLAASPSVPRQEAVRQEQIDAAVERGCAFLVKTYDDALARGRLDAVERVGQSALSLYTLLKSGAEPQSELVRKLLLHVSMQRIEHTYDAACTLLALAADDPMSHRPWIDELALQLVEWQTAEGDWGYPGGGPDLSNTQYAALGLWAASRAGFEVPSDVWTELARASLRYADSDGGFGYSISIGRGRSATGSMTAAGIGTLAICEARLRRAKTLPEELGRQIAHARERGLEWLATNFTAKTNPRSGGWHYYYLYGLERLGAFVGAPKIGAHDWYEAGARFLVNAQDEGGSWNNGTDLSDTCFALLFLRRATAFDAPRKGPVTGEDLSKEDASAFRIRADGEGPLSIQIAGWSRKATQALEWPGEHGHGPRVVRVEYYVDGELAAIEIGSPALPTGGSRFRTTHVFESGGVHRVKARALLRAHDDTEKALDSAEIEVTVTRTLPAWLADRRPSSQDNLLPRMKPSAKSSSFAKGSASPFETAWGDDFAIDGNPRTPWLAAAKDERPELSITLAKAEKCKVIQVRAAVLAPLGPGHLSRPVAIDVAVNGKSRGQLAMSPDPLQPMRLVLDDAVTIKRIDLAITSVARSESCPLVGIGEVELFAKERE